MRISPLPVEATLIEVTGILPVTSTSSLVLLNPEGSRNGISLSTVLVNTSSVSEYKLNARVSGIPDGDDGETGCRIGPPSGDLA